MDSPSIKQTVCKVLKIFQYGKYLVAYVLKDESALESMAASRCHVKSLKISQHMRVWQHLGVMLNVLKMSQPLGVRQHLGDMLNVLKISQHI